jgi:hypothetical protein
LIIDKLSATICVLILDIARFERKNSMNSPAPTLQRQSPWLIMMAGPYMSGTGGDPAKIAANRARLESYCLPIYAKGHLAVVGEWFALPILQAAGSQHHGDSIFDAYQYPVAHRLIQRCDAVLRIPGESRGADMDVAHAKALGLHVFYTLEDIPDAKM